MKDCCLISVGKLCDFGFAVYFDTICFHEKENLFLLVIDISPQVSIQSILMNHNLSIP